MQGLRDYFFFTKQKPVPQEEEDRCMIMVASELIMYSSFAQSSGTNQESLLAEMFLGAGQWHSCKVYEGEQRWPWPCCTPAESNWYPEGKASQFRRVRSWGRDNWGFEVCLWQVR